MTKSSFDMSALSGANVGKAGSKSSGADRDVTPITMVMPQGSTVGKVYVVVPAVTLASTHAYHEFFRVERWYKIAATKANEAIVIKATKLPGGKVQLTAPTWVFTSRGLDLTMLKAQKLAKADIAKAKRKPKAAKPAATVDTVSGDPAAE